VGKVKKQPAKRKETEDNEFGPRLELDRYVPGLLRWVHGALANDSSIAYRKHFGVSTGEWMILAYLGYRGMGTGIKMSQHLYMDKAAVSKHLAQLKEKKQIRTIEHSRRNIDVFLTDAGLTTYKSVLKLALKREQLLLKGFSEQEQEQLINFLRRLVKNARAFQDIDSA
jgi:DNA-binding MarR family transcriptional regulator